MKPIPITEALVVSKANEQTIARGAKYFQEGHVTELRTTAFEARANVSGSENYGVRLALVRGTELDGRCTCPAGEDGEFCKHQVALGLAWLEAGATVDDALLGAAQEPADQRLARYLAALSKEELIDWLLKATQASVTFSDRLQLAAARGSPGSKEQLMQWVTTACTYPDYCEWAEARSWLDGLEDLVATIEDHVQANGEKSILLLQHALETLHSSAQRYQGPSGRFGAALQRVREMHLQACTEEPPLPEALAHWLLTQHLDEAYSFFEQFPRYLDVMGPLGLAAYTQLVAKEWAAASATPGARESYEGKALLQQLQEIRVFLVQAATPDDLDAVISVLVGDASQVAHYCAIVEKCLEHNDRPKALLWLEQGLETFGAQACLIAKAQPLFAEFRAPEDFAELVWCAFAKDPRAKAYAQLKRWLEGSPLASSFCTQALALMEARLIARAPRLATDAWEVNWRNELIEAHSLEGNAIRVWELYSGKPRGKTKAQKSSLAVPWYLLPEVARLRGTTHPDDAAEIYLQLTHDSILHTNTQYKKPFEHMTALHALRMGAGQADKFKAELTQVRQAYKQRRNFMSLLVSLG